MDGLNFSPAGQSWTPIGLGTGYNFSEELYFSSNAAPASAVWPAANLGIFYPFYVQAPGHAQQAWIANGAAVAGNIEIGLYDEYGNQLSTTGTVAQSGTSVPQAVPFPAPTNGAPGLLLTPGRYYIGLKATSGSAQFLRWSTAAASTNINRMLGASEQALSTNPLPAVITFGSSARSYIPLMGVAYSGLTL